MSRVTILGGLLGAALLAVLAITITGGSDGTYHLKMRLASAGGLRDGSAVSMGGVRVGKVRLTLDKQDHVVVDAQIDKGKGPVPKDASIGISAVNFLGQKQISIIGGDKGDPAPSGYEIPASRVTVSTDLDQVLDTLDSDTRTRLTILLDEAGAAVVGRKWDIRQFADQVPPGLADLRALVHGVVTDNTSLAELLRSSDRFIAQATAKRADLNKMVDTLGATTETVAARRAALRAALAKAPGTLATLQRFLADLRSTTVPLGPAARQLTDAGPALQQTLAQLDPFRKAADPALSTATRLAPTLSRLGTQATPVVVRAQPTVKSLANLSQALPPLTDAVDHSADNLVAVLENWSRAIQLRDGVSHVFRGEATFSPDLLASVLDRLVKPAAAAQKKSGAKPAPASGVHVPKVDVPHLTAPAAKLPDVLKKTLGDTGKGVKQATQDLQRILGSVTTAPKAGSTGAPSSSAAGLLDFLLGR